MSTLLRQLQTPEPPVLDIPAAVARKTRFPVLILVDISASTGMDPVNGHGGPNADIHRINACLNKLINMLRTPPANSPLADNRNNIDVAILTYSMNVDVTLPWTPASDLPAMLPPLVPVSGTQTGNAILFGIDYALKHYEALKRRNIKCGMPHVFHITDGCPTDMEPGSPIWLEVQNALTRLASSSDPEKKYLALKSFVTANGCDINSLSGCKQLSDGRRVTGLDLMAELAAGSQTFELANTEDAFHDLVQLFTVLITDITKLIKRNNAAPDASGFASDNITVH